MLRCHVSYALMGAALLAACGGPSNLADVTPEPMPEGESFTGVYQSVQYGEMHMVQTGVGVIGEFRKDDRSGTIQGTTDGNVLRFRWTQTRELVRGRPTESSGRGYFTYVMGGDGRANLVGEWGLDDAEIGGGPWRAYKLRNREPELQELGTGGGEDPGDEGADGE